MVWMAALVLLLAILVLICLLALMDQYQTLALIRENLGITDYPRPISHAQTVPALSALGLRGACDAGPDVAVLFLSTSCSTCEDVARGMKGNVPRHVLAVVESSSKFEGDRWLAEVRLPADQVTVDADGSVAEAFGVSTTPSIVVLHHQDVVMAQTVPSYRQLKPLLNDNMLTEATKKKSFDTAFEGR